MSHVDNIHHSHGQDGYPQVSINDNYKGGQFIISCVI